MPRPREKWPPQVSADKAAKIVTKIYKSYGKTVNADLVAPILECSRKSSNFSKRLSALNDFGLVTYGKDIVSLTSLAERIAAPVSESERNRAIMEAFNNVDLLKSLLERFPGGHLPSQESVRNLLMREYQIPKETIENWYDFVVESFGVIPEKATAQIVGTELLKDPQRSQDFSVVPKQSSNTHTLPLPNGRSIACPLDLTDAEMEYFKNWFESWRTLSPKQNGQSPNPAR